MGFIQENDFLPAGGQSERFGAQPLSLGPVYCVTARSFLNCELRLRAESAPTKVASGRTGIRAIAVVPLQARSRLHRPKHAFIGAGQTPLRAKIRSGPSKPSAPEPRRRAAEAATSVTPRIILKRGASIGDQPRCSPIGQVGPDPVDKHRGTISAPNQKQHMSSAPQPPG